MDNISSKPLLLVEHVFPLTEFVGSSADVTFGGSGGIMSTARAELPYPYISRPSLEFRLLRVESNVTVVVTCIILWFKVLDVRLDVICKEPRTVSYSICPNFDSLCLG